MRTIASSSIELAAGHQAEVLPILSGSQATPRQPARGVIHQNAEASQAQHLVHQGARGRTITLPGRLI